MLEVLEGGLLTTVQDGGRHGWARYGVPPSGPMDPLALRAANLLVGNSAGAAGLEVTMAGPALRLAQPALIAVCGAEFELWVGEIAVRTWHAVYVRPGQVVRFGRCTRGMRACLAVSGGIALAPWLGSQATCLAAGLGGLEGRALRAGDVLPLGPAQPDLARRGGDGWPAALRPPYTPRPTLRAVLGPQDNHFSADALATLLGADYEVTPSCDRMGYRLAGPPLAGAGGEFISDGIVTGSVQVPPDGRPIVMMADHQTTGGYPKVATVIRADLALLAQCLPGDRIRFRAVTVVEAQDAWRRALGL